MSEKHSKQGRSSRTKGKVSELELAKSIMASAVELDLPVANLWRTPNSGGLALKGDIQGLRHFHIEVKRTEKIKIQEWCDQAESDCPQYQIPLVVFRRSRQPWRVVVRLEHFVELMLRLEQEPGGLLTQLVKQIEGDSEVGNADKE